MKHPDVASLLTEKTYFSDTPALKLGRYFTGIATKTVFFQSNAANAAIFRFNAVNAFIPTKNAVNAAIFPVKRR